MKLTPRKIAKARKMLEEGATYKEVAESLGVTPASIYRLIPSRQQKWPERTEKEQG